MADDKQYAATAYKLSELKKKGIVPFSRVGLNLLNLATLLITANFFRPEISNLNISLKEIFNSTSHASLFHSNLAYPIFKYILIITISLFLSSIIGRFIQTEILFLRFGKYPDGILKKSRILKANKLNKLLMLSLFTSALCICGILFFLKNEQLFVNFAPVYSFVNGFIYLLASLFVILGVVTISKEKFEFLESHRMTKGELIQEMKETEGSQETKKQIRSQGY